MFNKTIRPRRLRTSDTLRRMVRETRISADSLIWPIFIKEGTGICDEIESLPGQYHYSPDMLGKAVERMRAHGVSRVLLFVLLLWRGITIAAHAPDRFGALLVVGFTVQVALQAVLNVAVVTNTIPNTGISLPFFSSGGTSLMMLLGEMGIVLSVSRGET